MPAIVKAYKFTSTLATERTHAQIHTQTRDKPKERTVTSIVTQNTAHTIARVDNGARPNVYTHMHNTCLIGNTNI